MQVLKLKEKLEEAEVSIRKHSGVVNGAFGYSGSSRSGDGSPASSFFTTTYHPSVGEFGVDGEADLMYIPEYNFSNYMMECANLYGM